MAINALKKFTRKSIKLLVGYLEDKFPFVKKFSNNKRIGIIMLVTILSFSAICTAILGRIVERGLDYIIIEIDRTSGNKYVPKNYFALLTKESVPWKDIDKRRFRSLIEAEEMRIEEGISFFLRAKKSYKEYNLDETIKWLEMSKDKLSDPVIDEMLVKCYFEGGEVKKASNHASKTISRLTQSGEIKKYADEMLTFYLILFVSELKKQGLGNIAPESFLPIVAFLQENNKTISKNKYNIIMFYYSLYRAFRIYYAGDEEGGIYEANQSIQYLTSFSEQVQEGGKFTIFYFKYLLGVETANCDIYKIWRYYIDKKDKRWETSFRLHLTAISIFKSYYWIYNYLTEDIFYSGSIENFIYNNMFLFNVAMGGDFKSFKRGIKKAKGIQGRTVSSPIVAFPYITNLFMIGDISREKVGNINMLFYYYNLALYEYILKNKEAGDYWLKKSRKVINENLDSRVAKRFINTFNKSFEYKIKIWRYLCINRDDRPLMAKVHKADLRDVLYPEINMWRIIRYALTGNAADFDSLGGVNLIDECYRNDQKCLIYLLKELAKIKKNDSGIRKFIAGSYYILAVNSKNNNAMKYLAKTKEIMGNPDKLNSPNDLMLYLLSYLYETAILLRSNYNEKILENRLGNAHEICDKLCKICRNRFLSFNGYIEIFKGCILNNNKQYKRALECYEKGLGEILNVSIMHPIHEKDIYSWLIDISAKNNDIERNTKYLSKLVEIHTLWHGGLTLDDKIKK